MQRFCIMADCSLLWTLPAYALDAGKVCVFSGDRITVSQKASCLASKQAPANGQTCQLASVRDFDRGHIFKTALMDLAAGAEIYCRAIQVTTSCTIAKCSADGINLARNMVHTSCVPSVNHQFNLFRERAKKKKHGLWQGSFDLPSVSRNTK